MKRILLAVALLASMQVSYAQQQVKSASAAKAAVEAAKAATENEKKATKSATWVKYGQTLLDSYTASQGSGWLGATKQELQLLGEKPSSSENVVVAGQNMTKENYPTRAYYFNEAGQLAMIEVTNPIVPDALDKALEAFKKAASIDASKNKDVAAGISTINQKLTDEAYNAYSFGNTSKASQIFEKAAKAAATAPLSKIDTNAVYNAGFTAWSAGENERAEKFFEESIKIGYLAGDGEAYAKLADVQAKLGKKEQSKNTLEEGFKAYPQSQSILVGLINYYISSNEDTDRLFVLLDNAKKNEPGNASLYYVEGNIHKQLGNIEKAVAAYDKCAEINPAYEFGYIGKGILYYENAVDIQEKASNEMDDKKYQALVTEFEASLKNCIEPFEKAFEVSKDDSLKVSVCEYLKNACYRFSDDPAIKAKYDKYAKVVADGRAQ